MNFLAFPGSILINKKYFRYTKFGTSYHFMSSANFDAKANKGIIHKYCGKYTWKLK